MAEPLSTTRHTLDNGLVSRTVNWQGGTLRTLAIGNGHTGRTYSIGGLAFAIQLDDYSALVTSATATVVDADCVKSDSGECLTITLQDKRMPGTDIRLVYTLQDGEFFGRKWLELTVPEGKTLAIAKVTVEGLTFVDHVTCSHAGLHEPLAYQRGGTERSGVTFAHQNQGQPVYIDDFFFGLEWPRGNNGYTNRTVTCSHFPAWDVKGTFRSKKAVWGAAPAGEVGNWFLERYLPTIRYAQPKPIAVYNSWYDVRGPSMDKYGDTLTGFRAKLVDQCGAWLDSFVIDDGWQDHKSIYQPKSPEGLTRLRRSIEETLPGCRLGLWVPIGGGFSGLNRRWGRENGYEVNQRNSAFCLLGKNYNRDFRAILKKYIEEDNVNYFKHDFNYFICDNPDHGHRVEPLEAQIEGQTEGKLSLMRYMKSLNPDVFLNYTSSMNMSPWWLMHCDCIWFGGGDVSLKGRGTARERAITGRDHQMAKNAANKLQFPHNSIMTHGMVKGNFSLKHPCTIEEWEHYILMYFARGTTMWELYFTPELLADPEWAFVAKTMKWARANNDVLTASTRLILGNVIKEEPYGYAHTKGDRCIAFIRCLPRETGLELARPWKVHRTDDRRDVPAGSERPGFDAAAWETTASAQSYTNRFMTYRFTFDAPPELKGKASVVRITSIDEKAEVFLNDVPVGRQDGYGEAFELDISGRLRFNGPNLLALKIENKAGKGGLSGRVFIKEKQEASETAVNVELALEPTALGFDPAYTHADVSWHYPEKRDVIRAAVGDTLTLKMEPFDVIVLDIALGKGQD